MVSVSAFYTVNLSQLSTNKIEHLLACVFLFILALSLAAFCACVCEREGGAYYDTYAHSNFSRINSIDSVSKEAHGRGKINVNSM